MATARAQQRAGGVTGIHIWLIAFVALWLVSTVLLVWLYTEQTALQKRADDAVASSQNAQSDARKSKNAMGQIAQLATGSTDDDPATVQGKVSDLYARIRDEGVVPDASAYDDPTAGLLAGMTALYQAYRGEYDARLEAQKRADSLGDEVERLMAENTQRQEAFQDKEDALVAQVQELEGAHEQYREARDDEIDDVEERIAQKEQQSAKDIQEQRAQNTRLAKQIDEYRSLYDDLKGRLGNLQNTPSQLLAIRQGDGEILTAKPGEDVVYISLGRRQRITLGMQFAVYSADEGIGEDGQAKARIEVARVFETSSECVIRHMFSRIPIVEGDLVNSPIYDRDRSLTFVVTGAFDFDGDGQDDPDGADQIRAIVRDWGGTLTDKVTARVDFVVLGNPPPQPLDSENLSPQQADRQQALARQFDRYAQTLDTAQALSVPILTQQVFMRFLGY